MGVGLLALYPGLAGHAVAVVVILGAGFVRGYSGFGFSAILMAGLSLVLPPAEIVPLAIALEVVASMQQASGVWREISWRTFLVLIIASAIGNPLGVFLLVVIPADPMRLVLLVFILAVSAALLATPGARIKGSTSALAGAGFAAGLVNGATALSGLVLALYFALTAFPAAVMRATLIAYIFATDLLAGGLLAAAGLFDLTTALRFATALPLLAFGVWLGGRRFLATPPQSFRTFVLFLLIGLSAVGLLRSLF